MSPRRKPRCACGKVAVALCDELRPLDDLSIEEKLRLRSGDESVRLTCDALLCGGCRVVVGATFFCARPGASSGGVETQDRCPAHARVPALLRGGRP